MSRYNYCGTLELEINNKVPKNIMDFLFFCSNKLNDFSDMNNIDILHKFGLETKITPANKIELPSISIYPNMNTEIGVENNIYQDGKDNYKCDYQYPIEDYEIYLSYYLTLQVCSKHFEDRMYFDELLDLLRPYRFEDSIEDYMGHVSYNEYKNGHIDGSCCKFDKDYYWNYEKFEKEKNNRKFLCKEDCNYYSPAHLCEYYSLCLRAYNIGKDKNQTKEKI